MRVGASARSECISSIGCCSQERSFQRVIGSSVDDDEPLLEAGLDSIGAVELRNAFAAAFWSRSAGHSDL